MDTKHIPFKNVPILGRLLSRWGIMRVTIAGTLIVLYVAFVLSEFVGSSERSGRVGRKWHFPPGTVGEWSSTLEADGWRFEKENTIEGNSGMADWLFVVYKKILGDLELSANITQVTSTAREIYGGGGMYCTLHFKVRGPFENKTPLADGMRECRFMAARIIPQADVAIDSAMRNVRRREDKNLKTEVSWLKGVSWFEGQASTSGGWEVTVCKYLVGENRNDCKVSIMLIRRRLKV